MGLADLKQNNILLFYPVHDPFSALFSISSSSIILEQTGLREISFFALTRTLAWLGYREKSALWH